MEKMKYNLEKKDKKAKKNKGRRANREGGISLRKDGRYQGEVVTGIDSKGKKITKYVYSRDYNDCLKKVQDLAYQVRNQLYFEASKILLKDWLSEFLDYRKNSIKPTTLCSYETNIRVHLVPEFGHIPLKQLIAEDIQAFINKKYEAGYAIASVKKMYAILKSSIKKALIQEKINKNPCLGVELSSKEDKSIKTEETFDDSDELDEAKILTREEQKIFQEAITKYYYYELFITALFTGLRLGELVALKWTNVDLEGGYLKVTRTAVRVKTYDKNSKTKTVVSIQTPKTKASIRTVQLPTPLIEILKNHEIKTQEFMNKRLKKGLPYQDKDYVFPSMTGNMLEPRNVIRSFHNILQKNNIRQVPYKKSKVASSDSTSKSSTKETTSDIGFHSLRHTYASRLLEMKYSMKHIADLLGHTDVAFTARTYTHLLPDVKQDCIKALDELF